MAFRTYVMFISSDKSQVNPINHLGTRRKVTIFQGRAAAANSTLTTTAILHFLNAAIYSVRLLVVLNGFIREKRPKMMIRCPPNSKFSNNSFTQIRTFDLAFLWLAEAEIKTRRIQDSQWCIRCIDRCTIPAGGGNESVDYSQPLNDLHLSGSP